mmetsp:Transcript_11081/g.27262  ORF Transcript_11081/g.27262 Transcript_11081/m.27262 type:complete len:227 (-) Transcript_11081:228-908(-)
MSIRVADFEGCVGWNFPWRGRGLPILLRNRVLSLSFFFHCAHEMMSRWLMMMCTWRTMLPALHQHNRIRALRPGSPSSTAHLRILPRHRRTIRRRAWASPSGCPAKTGETRNTDSNRPRTNPPNSSPCRRIRPRTRSALPHPRSWACVPRRTPLPAGRINSRSSSCPPLEADSVTGRTVWRRAPRRASGSIPCRSSASRAFVWIGTRRVRAVRRGWRWEGVCRAIA